MQFTYRCALVCFKYTVWCLSIGSKAAERGEEMILVRHLKLESACLALYGFRDAEEVRV